MPKEHTRTQRIADLIQQELAVLLQREVKDPRLGLVTVSAVEVSKDLSYAKIYVTIFGDETKITEGIKILNNASGYLRTLLAHSVKLRKMPELKFIYDASISYGIKMSSMIDEAVSQDEKLKKERGEE